MLVDQQVSVVPKVEGGYESLDKALHDVQGAEPRAPVPPSHQLAAAGKLKRHHSLPYQQPRSVDNLIGAARNGPISSRTRRAQAVHDVQQYETPAEEDELLDEALTATQRAMKRLENNTKPLRQSASNLGLSSSQPYPSPSPSANSNQLLYADGAEAMAPKPLDLSKKTSNQYKWPTPPYEGGEWSASASASIWAAGNRI